MGMRSDYEIDFIGIKNDEELTLIRKSLGALSGYSFYNDGGCLSLRDSKWYSYKKDTLNVSKDFPLVIFIIFREFEEVMESDKYRIQNGKILQKWKLDWVKA